MSRHSWLISWEQECNLGEVAANEFIPHHFLLPTKLPDLSNILRSKVRGRFLTQMGDVVGDEDSPETKEDHERSFLGSTISLVSL